MLTPFFVIIISNTSAKVECSLQVHAVQGCQQLKGNLPLGMNVSDSGVFKWLRSRTIPKNRAYAHNLLSKAGLSINRPMNILRATKGLSLNDSYWIVEDGFEGTFDKYNLYDNRFSRVLALIAFTGYGSSIRSSLASSPEFTTNGMLPKCWRRESGKIKLYKGGTRFIHMMFDTKHK